MNYEQISQMTYAELRELEYDLNRVKCDRNGCYLSRGERMEWVKSQTTEQAEKDRAFHLEYHAEHDQANQVKWEATLRKRELDRQLAERKNPAPTVVDAYDSEDEPIGSLLVRRNAVVGRKAKKTAPPAPKTYFIPDVLWAFVKEYAGIYNYRINWNKKWSDISSHYALTHCPSIKAMTQKAFCKLGKENPDAVRKLVWKDLKCIRDVEDYREKNHGGNSRELTLIKLERLAPLFYLPDWCVAGVIVKWWACEYAGDKTVCCGKVKKITDKNITIDVYKSVRSHSVSKSREHWEQHWKFDGVAKRSTFSTDKGFKLQEASTPHGWVENCYIH